MPEEVKKEESKKKGPIGRLRDKVEDADEQLAVLSTLVRLGILVWSGGILTLNYVTIPGLPQQKIVDTIHTRNGGITNNCGDITYRSGCNPY